VDKGEDEITGGMGQQQQVQGMQPGGYQMVKVQQHNSQGGQQMDQRGHYGQQTSGQHTPNLVHTNNTDPNSSNGNSAENKSDEPYFSPNQNL
jgi:hypothetical protein